MSKPVLALFQDPKNPHKRKRVGNTPVGLKNIGNTCWFSAVIQVHGRGGGGGGCYVVWILYIMDRDT